MSQARQSRQQDHSSFHSPNNNQTLLSALRTFTTLTSDMLAFEQTLFKQAHALPREIFKKFRKIRESIEEAFGYISAYSSDDWDFTNAKDAILEQQIKLVEESFEKGPPLEIGFQQCQESRSVRAKTEERTTIGFSEENELLKSELESVKNQLRCNDYEYEVQIKKYNVRYDEMQAELAYYQQEVSSLREYAELTQSLQVEVQTLREVKERDQMLIQNMARKIRKLEVQGHGRDAILGQSRPQQSRAHLYYSPKVPSPHSPKSYLSYRAQ